MRNRARIVAAAEAEFRAHGAGVPLDRVAERAGVGRGTLYRHFPDRAALIAAVYAVRVDALEAYAADLPTDRLLEHLVVEIAALQADAPGLFAAVRTAHGSTPGVADVERRASALLADALAEAHRRGRVRPEVTLEDVRLVFAMVEGVVAVEEPAHARAQVRRALQVVLHGLLADGPEDLPEAGLVLPG